MARPCEDQVWPRGCRVPLGTAVVCPRPPAQKIHNFTRQVCTVTHSTSYGVVPCAPLCRPPLLRPAGAPT
eukprot:128231-Prymnesium_polylepis.1